MTYLENIYPSLFCFHLYFPFFIVRHVYSFPVSPFLQSISQYLSLHLLLPFHVFLTSLLYILTLALSYSSFLLIPPFPSYHHLTNRYHACLIHLLCNIVNVFDKMSNRPRSTSLRPCPYSDMFLSGPTPASLPSVATSKNSYFNSGFK